MVCIENVLNAGREKEKKKKVHKCNERGSLLSCTYSMIIMGSLFCATTVTLILILDFHIPQTKSQQDYLDNFQLDCDVPSNYTYGNICNSTSHSNQTLLNTTLQPPQLILSLELHSPSHSQCQHYLRWRPYSDWHRDHCPSKLCLFRSPLLAQFLIHLENWGWKLYFTLANNTYEASRLNLHVPLRGVLGPSPSKWKMDSSIFLHTWSLKENEYPELIDELLELTVYNFEKLHKATSFFGEAKTIKGSSVYRACLKGNASAVKVLKSGVSTEMNILRRINHANITKLSGFCVHKWNTSFLRVYWKRFSW